MKRLGAALGIVLFATVSWAFVVDSKIVPIPTAAGVDVAFTSTFTAIPTVYCSGGVTVSSVTLTGFHVVCSSTVPCKAYCQSLQRP